MSSKKYINGKWWCCLNLKLICWNLLSCEQITSPTTTNQISPKSILSPILGELAVSFELSGQFVNEAGISGPYIHIAHALEQAFNFTFGNVHKSKGRVFKRKPFNLTKALDYLKNLVIRENRNRVANKDEKRWFYNSLIYRCLQNGFRGVHRDSPILFASFFRPLLRQCIGHK